MHAIVLAVLSSGLLPADVPPSDEVKIAEVTSLQGRWACTTERFDGDDFAMEDVKGLEWNIQADKLVIYDGGLVVSRGAFAMDLSRNPPEFTFRVDAYNRTGYGIYRVRGDWLDLAYVYGSDGPRPKQFVSEKGSKVFLETYHRIKK